MSGGLEAPFGAILLLAAACLWWMSAMWARDLARQLAGGFCQRQNWQLLDQTVTLSAMWPTRNDDGRLCWRRRYRFDFSPDGGQRHSGELVIVGHRPARITAELPDGGQLIE